MLDGLVAGDLVQELFEVSDHLGDGRVTAIRRRSTKCRRSISTCPSGVIVLGRSIPRRSRLEPVPPGAPSRAQARGSHSEGPRRSAPSAPGISVRRPARRTAGRSRRPVASPAPSHFVAITALVVLSAGSPPAGPSPQRRSRLDEAHPDQASPRELIRRFPPGTTAAPSPGELARAENEATPAARLEVEAAGVPTTAEFLSWPRPIRRRSPRAPRVGEGCTTSGRSRICSRGPDRASRSAADAAAPSRRALIRATETSAGQPRRRARPTQTMLAGSRPGTA